MVADGGDFVGSAAYIVRYDMTMLETVMVCLICFHCSVFSCVLLFFLTDEFLASGRPRGPLGWLDPGAFGTLGVGGGFALGVKLCRPDSDVWVIYGDGSLGYSIVEFDTFVRHKVSTDGSLNLCHAWADQLLHTEALYKGVSPCLSAGKCSSKHLESYDMLTSPGKTGLWSAC